MQNSDKIFVAGHRGLVGSALLRKLKEDGFGNLVTRDRSQLDLMNEAGVDRFFADERPAIVIFAAAKVGGIKANNDLPVEFLLDNLQIQNNVIRAAHQSGVRKFLFLGSSCIYPKFAPQPIPETALLSGPLEPTNEAYAIAKIAGIKLGQAYARQYGANYHLLNTIAKYDSFTPNGKTGLRNYERSRYCQKNGVSDAFEHIVKNANFKYIFLSYNNEGLMSAGEVKKIMKKYGEYGLETIKYQRFKADKTENRNHLASETVEYLHILEKF